MKLMAVFALLASLLGCSSGKPQVGGDGRLVTGAEVHDITDDSVMNDNFYIQKGV